MNPVEDPETAEIVTLSLLSWVATPVVETSNSETLLLVTFSPAAVDGGSVKLMRRFPLTGRAGLALATRSNETEKAASEMLEARNVAVTNVSENGANVCDARPLGRPAGVLMLLTDSV